MHCQSIFWENFKEENTIDLPSAKFAQSAEGYPLGLYIKFPVYFCI